MWGGLVCCTPSPSVPAAGIEVNIPVTYGIGSQRGEGTGCQVIGQSPAHSVSAACTPTGGRPGVPSCAAAASTPGNSSPTGTWKGTSTWSRCYRGWRPSGARPSRPRGPEAAVSLLGLLIMGAQPWHRCAASSERSPVLAPTHQAGSVRLYSPAPTPSAPSHFLISFLTSSPSSSSGCCGLHPPPPPCSLDYGSEAWPGLPGTSDTQMPEDRIVPSQEAGERGGQKADRCGTGTC